MIAVYAYVLHEPENEITVQLDYDITVFLCLNGYTKKTFFQGGYSEK